MLSLTAGAAIVLGCLLLLVGVILVPHNLRVRRVRQAYRTLPANVRQQVLAMIQAAATRRSVTMLRLDPSASAEPDDVLVESHVGGVPYAEAGESWPESANGDEPARFLLQVRLVDPGLGPIWQGRLLTVFFQFDYEQIVRSYPNPSPENYVPLDMPHEPFQCIQLLALRYPAETDEEQMLLPVEVPRLLELAPGIAPLLAPYGGDATGLVTQVLRPDLYGYGLEAPDIAYVGGDPMLIQNPHDAVCPTCGRAMRFLFQFGEMVGELQMADAGVGYVYGCDEHPEHCTAIIDSH